MPFRTVVTSLGGAALVGPSGLDECQFVGIPETPMLRGVALMIVHDTLVRIDVDSGAIATTWGDRIGDTESQILARHPGQMTVEPHKYTGPEGHYLVLSDSSKPRNRIIFETDGRRVLRYRAGRRPEVDWIEGCA